MTEQERIGGKTKGGNGENKEVERKTEKEERREGEVREGRR